MKTLLLAAAVLTLGLGAANADTGKDAMRDTMKQTETMRDGDSKAMQDAAPNRQTSHTATPAWQDYNATSGGGG